MTPRSDPPTPTSTPTPRFYRLVDLAGVFNVSEAQVYAMVRTGELPAIKVGGRGQWRIERVELERYIAQNYADTRAFIDNHPFGANAKDETVFHDDHVPHPSLEAVLEDLAATNERLHQEEESRAS